MRKSIFTVLALLALAMLSAGCAATNATVSDQTNATATTSGDAFVTDSYKALATAGITYQAVMQTAGTMYANKQLGDDAKAKLIVYGNAFRGVYQTAVLALEEYVKLGSSDAAMAAKVTQALADLATNFADLKTYAQSVGVAVQEAK